jgi:hypothetical protein
MRSHCQSSLRGREAEFQIAHCPILRDLISALIDEPSMDRRFSGFADSMTFSSFESLARHALHEHIFQKPLQLG